MKNLKGFVFTTIFLFSFFLVNFLVPGKVQAYTQQDCVNIAVNCITKCANSVTYETVNTVGEACVQKCINEITVYCKDPNNSQPQAQLPVVQQPQQKTQPTAVEDIPREAVKGQPFSHDYSKELIALLGPDSPGCPCSFGLDTMGGFPPMGLSLWPVSGVLKGTPTGQDSKFRACVTDVGGNTACKVINIDVKKEGEPELVVPENFRLTELAYNNLTYGQQFQSSQDERAVIKMPDGSEMHMDMGSTITPVSDYEVKSDTGRFMYDYKPASGGGCGPIGQSPTWACRQVDARDATLRVKGTQFAVDTDKYGTNITVMEGVLSVSDPKGKKTVEVAGGQYTYIAKLGLPTDPQSFDISQVDFWWEKKTSEQTLQALIGIIVVGIGLFIIFLIVASVIILINKIISRRKKPATEVAPAVAGEIQKTAAVEKNNGGKMKKGCSCALAVMVFVLFVSLAIFFHYFV